MNPAGGDTARRKVLPLGSIALLLLIILFCVFPFYWMVTTSLKTQIVALSSPPVWAFEPTLSNYTTVLFDEKVGASLINSLIVAVFTTALADRKSTRLNSSHTDISRMPSSA